MLHVFNSTYNRVFKETRSKAEADKRASMAMRSVLSKRMEKYGAYVLNSHHDWFSYCQDLFLSNMK